MQPPSTLARRLMAVLSSSKFFWCIIGLLVIQAVWIALSGRYPMAFDEDFHLGIIRLYAHHLSPFWSGQPPGADAYGAVARDPSYLYQYLMSFPYRLISLFTHDQSILVLTLRGINIALFASGLVFFRRLLLKTGASRAIAHASLLIFVLLPTVPFLAAQINYDNLFIPLTGLALLMTVGFIQELRQYKRINSQRLIEIFIVCLVTSLVKYAFLPIFLAIVIYSAWLLWRTFPQRKKLWLSLGFGLTLIGRRSRWLLAILLILACGLFIERYGVNTIRYHTPVPDCGQVLSVKQCSAYGPWIRDYDFSVNRLDEEKNPLVFTGDWLYGMWLRVFFAVGGPATDFETRGPLMIPGFGSIIFGGLAILLVLRSGRQVFRRYDRNVLGLLIVVLILYIAALWLDEYRAYLRTGQPVAINGRYLLPVLLPLFAIVGLSATEALKRKHGLKLAIAGLTVLSLLWGGGALTYILRSQDSWNWPNAASRDANHAARTILGPVVPGSRQPTEFLR